MKLIVGLGNPGERYRLTRHNIGFMVAERLAARNGLSLKRRGHQGIHGVGRVGNEQVTVLLPQTFMNHSGASVGSAVRSLGIAPGDLLVIHDDLDLDYGRIRFRAGGGHGGHNGLRHIIQVLGHGDFARCKLGIGRPPAGQEVVDYVLRPFGRDQARRLEELVDRAAEAVELFVTGGLQAAMNKFNNQVLTD
ncbi:peptidyl-tRNA hydrolase [Geothermobacter ehrlichii]|uniref:Peptidyl-tRNA hydrolase n=1 Tax=Geothermobacter ehrlichii TaxID=213224 RepID=A0A5D3WM73_9BACT|nr:aminoacyl-tRNA hydrolase [Geothermobacter ehrlichii]TYO98646.1 peptidyl-tRNA hydrolase [Geothermobacter ehrlichii]